MDPMRVPTASVVEQRRYGENHELRNGTKHFRGGAKVFVIDGYWGMCNSVTVVGHHRASGRYITLDMPVKHLEHFRMSVVYSLAVLKRISDHYSGEKVYSEDYGEKLLEALPHWKAL